MPSPDDQRQSVDTFLFPKALAFLCLLFAPFISNAQTASAPWVGDSLTGAPCHGKSQGYGPYNYLEHRPRTKELRLVEGAHFTHHVETLSGGAKGKGGNPLPDLDYTLRAFPNHHRALNTAIRYHFNTLRIKGKSGLPSPTECYLQRAINFTPKDAISHMLYGIFLHRKGLLDQAQTSYETAEELQPLNLDIKYNLGLLFVKQGDMESAKEKASFIYARGFPLSGLKRMLENTDTR